MAGFLSYQNKNGRQYASWCRSYRDPNIKDRSRSPKRSVLYLGRVIDKERGIYKNKTMGYVRFDPTTQEFLPPPPDFVPPPETKARAVAEARPDPNELVVDFGDSYLIHQLGHTSGLMGVLERLELTNPDTIMALLSFTLCHPACNYAAQDWLRGNFASHLYPQAQLSRPDIAAALAELGAKDNWRRFFTAYLETLKAGPIDLGADIPCPAMAEGLDGHILYLTEQTTGRLLLLFYNTGQQSAAIKHAMQRLREMGLKPSSTLIASGATDLKACKDLAVLTGIGSDQDCFQEAVTAYGADLLHTANLVPYGQKGMFIKQLELSLERNRATGETCDGYGYLCRDLQRYFEEQEQAYQQFCHEELAPKELDARLKAAGAFMLFATKQLELDELLSYYDTQQALADFSANVGCLGPRTAATLRGSLLLTFMAAVLWLELHRALRTTPYRPRDALLSLRAQKIRLVDQHGSDLAAQQVNALYQAAQLEGPAGMVLTLEDVAPLLPALTGAKSAPSEEGF